MLFAAGGRGGLLVKPCPLLRSQIKAEIKGFLLMYCLFLYYLWFIQNIEKGWRKYIFIIFVILRNCGNNLISKIFPQRNFWP